MYVSDLLEKRKVQVRITKTSTSDLSQNSNFVFDWSKEKGYNVFKLETKTSNELLGLLSYKIVSEELRIEIRLIEINKANVGKHKRYERIAGILLAHACKRAFDLGFYGFVSLIPKTKLQEHYQQKYGFRKFGRHLAIQLKESESIMNKYLANE